MTGQTTRLGSRTVVQRLAGAAVLVIGLGGFWYWWAHPLPGGAAMRQAVLAGQARQRGGGMGPEVLCPQRPRPPERGGGAAGVVGGRLPEFGGVEKEKHQSRVKKKKKKKKK